MNQAKILIIDDEKIFVVAAKRELELVGFIVKTALNGKDAIDLVKNEHFDLVFTDLVMPGMNGVEVCKNIKSISPKTEVFLISGHPKELEDNLLNFLHAGGKDKFIRKPLLDEELSSICKTLINNIKNDIEI